MEHDRSRLDRGASGGHIDLLSSTPLSGPAGGIVVAGPAVDREPVEQALEGRGLIAPARQQTLALDWVEMAAAPA
jgi:hypothetical protein